MAIEQQVFWLQISVNYFLLVQVFDCQDDFGGIELGYWVGESLLARGVSKQLVVLGIV